MNTAAEPPPTTVPVATVRIPHRRVASGLVPEQTMRCTRCGLTFHPATIQHDQTLLFAACCPRCDGQPRTPLDPSRQHAHPTHGNTRTRP
jgi:uncharacterized paraquat-inducible protein A